jgi:hypothetical protein
MTEFWDKLLVLIFFVPPFVVLEQCPYFIVGHNPCQELFTEFRN